MKKMMVGMLLATALVFASNAMAAGDAAKGKAAFATCQTCHGVNGEGNQALNAPRLAGLDDWYMVRQLQNFKAGARGSHAQDTYGAQMKPMAMTLANDQAIEDVVAHVKTLNAATPAPSVMGDAAAGKSAFAVCQGCHGANGEGNKAMNAPRLNGQHGWYLARQISNFKAGIRGADPKDAFGAQMRPMSMTLADEKAINNVVAHIQTLK